MIKNFNKFVKESVENKGKGPGNQDLIPSAPKKQTINRSIQTMDFLRIGKHISTPKIDGFIDSVQNESIYITDRITGEIKKYTLKEVLKELTKSKDNPNSSSVQGFEGTPAWATKQKIYEATEDYERERSPEYEPDEVGTEQEQEEEFGPDQEEIEIGGDEEEDDVQEDDGDVKNQSQNQAERNKLLYGTEDNPLGLPNKGVRRSSPNESWKKYWEKYNQQIEMVKEQLEEELDEEEEVKIVRGTEDNPLPAKGSRKPKIENY